MEERNKFVPFRMDGPPYESAHYNRDSIDGPPLCCKIVRRIHVPGNSFITPVVL
ncbi:hypothetical protein L9F63_010245, partial [Diploptera punctata]